MIRPSTPTNENTRLKELLSLNILDTSPEDEYDEITALASQVCEAPISLISLIDKDRQWFKSRHGTRAVETPRDFAFCAHAIMSPNSLFEVSNTITDHRFHDNPLVVRDPYVIFYAGMPLVTSRGHALGTLCVIDNKPKKLSESQRKALKTLSNQVATNLELRKNRVEKNLEKEKQREKSAMLKEMANLISYDLKSPINNIIGLSEALSDPDNISPELRKKLSKLISLSAYQLKDLIDDALTYAASQDLSAVLKINSFSQNSVNLNSNNML